MDPINPNQPEQNQVPDGTPEQPVPASNIGADLGSSAAQTPATEPDTAPSISPDVTPQPAAVPQMADVAPVQENVQAQPSIEPSAMSNTPVPKSSKHWIAIGVIVVLLIVVALVYYLLYK